MDTPGAPAPTAAPGPGRKELKIVIVGDGGCGKTSLLMVYSQGSFPEVRPAPGWGGRLEAGRLGAVGMDLGPLGTRNGLQLEPRVQVLSILRTEKRLSPRGAPSGIPEPSKEMSGPSRMRG